MDRVSNRLWRSVDVTKASASKLIHYPLLHLSHPTSSPPIPKKKKCSDLSVDSNSGAYVVLAWGGASDRRGALGTDDVVAHTHYLTP